MTDTPTHRELRVLLGPYALGHLSPDEQIMLRAHLDGCAECRAELAEIEGVARALGTVDPSRLEHRPAPPAGLGERIRSAIQEERTQDEAEDAAPVSLLSRRRTGDRRTSAPARLLAASVLLIALAGGFFVGRESVPGVPVVASETVAMSSSGAAPLTVDAAALVAHTWGVELRISGSGFAKGEVFQAAFQVRSGAWVPAGEFLGTGAATLTCNLQAGRLRDDVVAVQITDQAGETVLASSL